MKSISVLFRVLSLLLFSSLAIAAEDFLSIEIYDMSHIRPFMIENHYIQWPTLIDIDSDGDLDLLMTSWDFFTDEKDPPFLMLNDGNGIFSYAPNSPYTPVPTVGSQHWPMLVDLNQDGRKDLYMLGMGNEGGEDLDTWWAGTYHQLLLNVGTEGLIDVSEESLIETRRSVAHSAAFGDIDGDGDIDLFNAGLGLNRENLETIGAESIGSFFWINNGDAVFSASDDRVPELYNADRPDEIFNVQDAILVDIDRDSDLDLLLTMPTTETPNWLLPEDGVAEPAFLTFLNDGNGFFTRANGEIAPSRQPPGDNYFGHNIFSSDFNGDGWPDLILSVVTHQLSDGALQLMLNNGDGTFSNASENIAFETPWQIQQWSESGYILRLFIEDYNGDTWPDILTLGSGYKPKLHINNGDGSFSDATANLGDLEHSDVTMIVVGDIDGDSDIDIVSPSTGCEVYCPSFTIARNTGSYAMAEAAPLPGTPMLNLPEDAANTAARQLSWEHVPGAQTYAVQVSRDADFAVFEQADLSRDGITGNLLEIYKLDSLKTFDALIEDNVYYWRVAAVSYSGQGNWSETRSFEYSLDELSGTASFNGEILHIPVLAFGDDYFELNLSIIRESPIELQVQSYSVIENQFETNIASFIDGILTVPKLNFEEKNYRLDLELIETSPYVFRLSGAVEL